MSGLISINENYLFRRVYAKGKSRTSPSLVTYVLRNREGTSRMGITASKKVGCAVKRNRARRIIKEAYRLLMPQISGNFDIVFIARSSTVQLKTTDILPVMESHLRHAGVIGSPARNRQ